MRKIWMLGAMALALVVPATSKAGVSIGGRIGFAPAAGDAFTDRYSDTTYQMSDGIKSQIPLQLDVMFDVAPQVSLGGYLSYGFGQVGGDLKDECDYYDLDCSARSVRLGFQAHFPIGRPGTGFVPWLGAGLGYEWTSYKEEGWGESYELKAKGPELNLQIGGDFRATPQFSIGPYLMLSFARYSSVEVESTGGSGKASIDEKLHEWIGFGVRGKFDL